MNHFPRIIDYLGQAILAAILLVTYAPVLLVIAYSFNESKIGSVWSGFSTRWYGELWRRDELWSALRTSIVVGAASSTIAVTLGALAAWGIFHFRRTAAKSAAQGVLAIPLVMPEVIMGISLALFFNLAGIVPGVSTIIVSHGALGLAYAYVVLAAAVAKFDHSLIEAALDCGATPAQAHWRVTLPLLLPSLVTAWLFAFVLSFDDFLIAFFTKGVGYDTLPIRVYSQMRFGVRPVTNALFTLMFLLGFACLSLVAYLNRKDRL